MKQRNHAFDILCGICILRMVCLHVMQFCGKQSEPWWVDVMSWSYFFMSFFFFKAGFFNKGVTGHTPTYLLDRTKRLLVPYLTAGSIGFVIYMAFLPFIMDHYHHPIEPLAWNHLWLTSSFYGNGPVWFLFSFFSMYVVVHLIENFLVGRGALWRWAATFVVCLMPLLSYTFYTMGNPVWMSLSNLPIGIFFFYLGHWWHEAIQRLGRERTLWLSVVMIVAFVVLTLVWGSEYTMVTNDFRGPLLPLVVAMVCILCGLSGVLLMLDVPRVPWLCYIGEHSMVYFISHYPILSFYKFTHICFGRSIYNHYDDVIVLLPAIFMICSWLVPYIEAAPWLSGRWKKS